MKSTTSSIAFLFPGQASQSVGMGQDLVEAYSQAAEAFERADAALGFGLSDLCFAGPLEELTETRNAQPAILLHSLAVARVLESRLPELQPRFVAGHSLGEISALTAAGSLSLENGLKVVRARGELMWEAGVKVPGTMAAVVGLETERIEELCAEISGNGGGVVVVANLNSPTQVVISGDVSAVEAAGSLLKEAGARRVMPLKVSGAFHSPLMEVVQGDFAREIQPMEWKSPACPVVANVSAEPVSDPQELREGLVRQLTSPVRWHESVQRMVADGVETFIELGPGKVLSNLGARSFPNARFLSTSDAEGLEKVLATLEGTL